MSKMNKVMYWVWAGLSLVWLVLWILELLINGDNVVEYIGCYLASFALARIELVSE